jgi:hypothetical protein
METCNQLALSWDNLLRKFRALHAPKLSDHSPITHLAHRQIHVMAIRPDNLPAATALDVRRLRQKVIGAHFLKLQQRHSQLPP